MRSTGMPFDWDRAKPNHIARHGVTPPEAEPVISGASLRIPGEWKVARTVATYERS